MGIEFRGKNYRKDVSFGKRTVKQGEAVAIWNRLGEHRQVEGPDLVRLFFSTIMFLDRKTAGPNEYLVVSFTNGNIEHHRGPLTMFENPVFHNSITVQSAYSLKSSSECIVLNRENRKVIGKSEIPQPDSTVERVIVRGPNLFFPSAGDQIINFSWHGTSSKIEGDIMMANADQFTTLYLGHRNWKVDLPFNCNDKVNGTLQFTFAFHIYNIDLMLDRSNDTTGDLLDSLKVDIANITTINRDLMSIQDITRLNIFSNIELFTNLLSRANFIGVQLESVSLRGVIPSRDIQKNSQEMAVIQSNIEKETIIAKQKSEKIEADLTAQRSRVEQESNLEMARLASRRAALEQEHEYKEKEQEYNLSILKSHKGAEMEDLTTRNNESLRVLKGLADLGVDLTKLLTTIAASDSKKYEKNKNVNGVPLVAKMPVISDMFASEEKL